MKNILFIVQYPRGISPSQRFRIELYEDLLTKNGFQFRTEYFIDNSTRKILFLPGNIFLKIWGTMKGFFRRVGGLFTLGKYDYVFIQREASPLGPPVFEWLYSKVFRKKVIYDFDDAIWVPSSSGGHEWTKFIKCFWKIKYICKWAYKVSVGNDFLYNYAIQYNNQVILNPTCVDTESTHNRLTDQQSSALAIGWTGSYSTLPYLDKIMPALLELEKKYNFDFIVIADKDPLLPLKGYKFIKWKRETEVADLSQINIGLMPLIEFDDPPGFTMEHAEGKCGFKIIQYSALGIPTVASPVGVNQKIIENNINGFLTVRNEDWVQAIEQLIVNAELRISMGNLIRNKIIKSYSLKSNSANFLSLFQ